MPPLIVTAGLTKDYPLDGDRRIAVLRGIDLLVEAGECLSLMGPSGSGKSTLMNILGCLDTPTSGIYQLDGQDIAALDERALARLRGRALGFVFQSFNLIPRSTALSNVILPMRFTGEGIDMALARALLDRVGLGHRIDHPTEKLSGGERQRVAIARALVNHPRLILADEPTGNLDSRSGEAVMDLLLELNRQGITLILVTHDPSVAERTPRVVRLRDGRIA